MYFQKPMLGTPLNPFHWASHDLAAFWLMNEAGGDKIYDLSGNGNTGTLTGMSFPGTATSGWGAGKFGSALNFDSSNDYVDCGDEIMDFRADSGAFTISARIKTSYGAADNYILGTNLDTGVYMRIDHGSGDCLLIKIDDGVNAEYANGTSALDDNIWHNLLLIVNSDTTEFLGYVDGIKEITLTTGSVGNLANTFKIGRVDDPTPRYFNGEIDLVSIYNRGFNAQQVQQLSINPFCMFAPSFEMGWLYSAAEAAAAGFFPGGIGHKMIAYGLF